MIKIAGRPRRNWECTVRAVEETIVIRLDDRDDPEFWTEVVLDGLEMEQLWVELFMQHEQRHQLPEFPDDVK